MDLYVLLEQLQYSQETLRELEDYEKEFLRERTLELGVSQEQMDMLEDMMLDIPKGEPKASVTFLYKCPELGMVKSCTEWRDYFGLKSLNVISYIASNSKLRGLYSFVKVGSKSRKGNRVVISESGKIMKVCELSEYANLSQITVNNYIYRGLKIKGEKWRAYEQV